MEILGMSLDLFILLAIVVLVAVQVISFIELTKITSGIKKLNKTDQNVINKHSK